ncbi:hypothetical protein N7U66_15530 [Lacinutrix neustonica]|uniref:Uncharacterized protein n=1 Tax=Lacinutrix neustonica TaxID=2980107 RepID=A0A9E8MV11_9FLAO|nr:hypothetical protein [Lacinutrix neustonica]WAC01434.1 hypothetical protein N7U66_15530 [Lacinutrix neustonica]
MINKNVIIGLAIGLVTTLIGITCYTIFIGLQLGLSTEGILNKITSTSVLGKRASIGALLNIPIFYLFLNKKRKRMPKAY